MIGAQIDRLVGSATGKARIDSASVLDRLVVGSMTSDAAHPIFQQALFDREYARFEEAIHESTVTTDIIVPLQGFKMESDFLQIEHGLKIARLTMEEIDACIRLGVIRASLGPLAIPHPPQFAIKLAYQQPKLIGDDPPNEDQLQKAREMAQENRERIARAVNALRLWKSGDLWTTGTIEIPTSWLASFIAGSAYGTIIRPGPGNYPFTKDEVWVFQAFWKMFETAVLNRKFLDVAVKRFDYAQDRLRPQDKIIDLMVALEALFLSDMADHEYRGELRFRLALRAAFFLAESPSERKTIYNLFRDAYDIRSAIVHGGEPELPKGFSSLDEFVNRLAESTRNALHRGILLASSSGTAAGLLDWTELVLSTKALQGEERPFRSYAGIGETEPTKVDNGSKRGADKNLTEP